MTQLGEGPMVYYKLQMESKLGDWWVTVESTPFSVEHLQESKEELEAKGRKTRILKVEVTVVGENKLQPHREQRAEVSNPGNETVTNSIFMTKQTATKADNKQMR